MTNQQLKLDTKRTFLIGLAFFGILMLWRIVYIYAPLYLEDMLISKYGDGDYNYIIGIIMALENLFALGLIPLFGLLSDKTRSRFGRRIPYIAVGSIAAMILFPLLSVMAMINSFVWFIVIFVLLIISMCAYRAPAVALMPDITPKPLRPKANAIVNFVGYVGAIIASLLTMFFTMDNPNLTVVPFIITAVLMLFSLVMLVIKVKENKVGEQVRTQMELGEQQSETLDTVEEDKPLGRRDRINLVIIIAAVFMAFFAFAALDKFGTLFAKNVLGAGVGDWALVSGALAVTSVIVFLPSIKLTQKIGRKNSILVGLGLIITVMFAAGFVTEFGPLLIALFAVSGAGWAIVNVNTYPMVVEMASRKNVGRFTGIYYTASQAAQALTSIVVGFVFDWLGLEVYFFYAVIFMAAAFILCLFFKTNPQQRNHTPNPNHPLSPSP